MVPAVRLAALNTRELEENDDDPFQYLPLDCWRTATPTDFTPEGSVALPVTDPVHDVAL